MSAQQVTKTKGSVAIIGGGIAGITAAAKLLGQGYHVTIFEKESVLGGNLSSNSKDNKGDGQDVYPHIFGDWYSEFWHLLKTDFEIDREKKFLARDHVRMAIVPAKNHAPKGFGDMTFATVATPTTLINLIGNGYSDILSKRDMFLFGYTYLDLISVPPTAKRTSKLLEDLDVTGYLYSRPYMNNEIADFHDDILKVIWSMPSDLTSAKAYQKLLRHTLTFPQATPFAWLIKGPLNATLLNPITDKLKEKGCVVRTDTTVAGLAIDPTVVRVPADAGGFVDVHADGFVKIKIEGSETERFDFAVIATTAKEAGVLALGDGSENSLVDRKPNLARLREAVTGRIPVVYLYFKETFLDKNQRDLEALPRELTGFKVRRPVSGEKLSAGDRLFPDDAYDISIHNIATVWESQHLNLIKGKPTKFIEPALVVAASRATAITARGPEETEASGQAQGFRMLKRLNDYFPFINVGTEWGVGGDIDWERTRVITNENHQLFLNDTGSNEWRPKVKLQDEKGKLVCRNVFFAGDYCMTDVDMATVEAAVQSGVLAAQALCWENESHATWKEDHAAIAEIIMQKHTVYGPEALLVAKLVSTPAAFVAAIGALHEEASADPVNAIKFPMNAASIAAAYWADWLRSVVQLGGHYLPDSDEQNEGPVGFSGRHDKKIGIVGMAANVARALIVEGPNLPSSIKEEAVEALYTGWYRTVGRTLFPNIRKTFRDPEGPKPRPVGNARDPSTTWSGLVGEAFGDSRDTADTISKDALNIAKKTFHVLRGKSLEDAIAERAEAYKRRTER